jgi:hypothetical protein
MSSHDVFSLNSIIGKCLDIRKTSDGVTCKFEYFVGQGNEEADWAFVLAKKGIAAFSVGFIAHGYEWEEDKIKEILKEEEIKVGKGRRVRGIITEAELYEVSQVNVPCNPDALMKSKSLGFSLEEKDTIIEAFDELENEIKSIYDKIEIKGVVPFKSYPVVETEEWDASVEVEKIREWAGGNWNKYSKAFLYVDDEKKETYGAYKFPHHSIVDGELKTNRQGVFAAMQRLSSGDVSDEDRQKMYTHLSKHYTRDLDEEPPELKSLIELNKKEEGKKIMVNVELNEIVEMVVEKAVKAISKEIVESLPEVPGVEVMNLMEEKINDLSEQNAELKSLIVDFEKKFVTIKEEEAKVKEEEKELEIQKAKEEEVEKKEKENNDLYADLLAKIENFKI